MCVSWPSKEVKAATQLYKEMEYETSTNGGEKTVNVDKHQYATFTWELYKHSTSLPPFKLEIWIKISRHKIH